MDRTPKFGELTETLRAVCQSQSELGTSVGHFVHSFRASTTESQPSLASISKGMRKILPAVSRLAVAGDQVAAEQAFLQNLSFREMDVRHAKIVATHSRTYEWIFQDNAHGGTSFTRWLTSGQGCFWVSGKPGSGKLTLMKLICGHDQTRQALLAWAGPMPLVTAKYFFWNAGTPLQKPLEGLLRSLLFEILRQCPEIISTLHEHPHSSQSYQYGRQWLPHEVIQLFRQVIQQSLTSARFCFFIDGLDEYDTKRDGDLDDLVTLLRGLADSKNIKVLYFQSSMEHFPRCFRE